MKQLLYHEQFDRETEGGLSVGSLHGVFARPGTGRTTWALERAFYSSKNKVNTLFITLESSIQDNIEQLFRMVGKEEIATHPMTTFHLVESSDASFEDVKKIITSNVERNGITMVWIDSADYFIPEDGFYMKEEKQYIQVMNALKALAEELSITIIVTQQLNRSVEPRNDKRPLLTDIESLALQKVYHTVIGLYRELHTDNEMRRNAIETRILKNADDFEIKLYEETFLKKNQR